MTKKLEVYKCPYCGNVVSVLHTGDGELVCCGKPMLLMKEQTKDSTKEKHVPFIEKIEDGYKVRIGQNENHPMEEKHYIEWIELITDKGTYKKFLSPKDKPEAIFYTKDKVIKAREYCNIHGLWKK
jgi:superoxide reductase